MTEIILRWTSALQEENFLFSFVASVIFFIIAITIELYGGSHSKKVVAPGLSDVILDRLPVINFNFIFTDVTIILIIFFSMYQITHPASLPFVLATVSTYVIVHRAFVFMTAIGPHKNFLYNYGFKPHRTYAQKFQNINDFFFSGHTGLLFLFFLLTPLQPLAYMFLVGSILVGIAVLFMHIHYSIDVFGAYFVTYSIFALASRIFE